MLRCEINHTPALQDSSSADVPPVVLQAVVPPSAEVVQDVELPQESQFSEDEPWEFGVAWVFLRQKWVGVKLVKGNI